MQRRNCKLPCFVSFTALGPCTNKRGSNYCVVRLGNHSCEILYLNSWEIHIQGIGFGKGQSLIPRGNNPSSFPREHETLIHFTPISAKRWLSLLQIVYIPSFPSSIPKSTHARKRKREEKMLSTAHSLMCVSISWHSRTSWDPAKRVHSS